LHRDGGLTRAKRRVAIFSVDLTAAGGAERVVFEEATALADRGFEVRVLACRYSPDVTFSGRYAGGLQVFHVGGGSGLRGFIAASIGLLGTLIRWRPDLVIATSPNECARLFLPSLLTGTPYITHINGTQFWFPPEQDLTKYAWAYRKVLRKVLQASPGHEEFVPLAVRGIGPVRRVRIELSAFLHRLAVRRASARITFSRRMAWEVELMYGRPALSIKGAFPETILRYRPTTDPTRRYRIAGGPLALNVNRLEPRKRVALTVRAFELVLQHVPNAALVIGGVGPSEHEVRKLIEARGLGDRVHMIGFIAEQELWDWLANCDVFVHPNWAEFAIAPYEALALGTNVVWSTEMEIDQLEGNPHIFPARPDAAAMAEQILKALGAPKADERERELLRAYSWEHYFAELSSIVDRVIHKASPTENAS
jgi:glycosyltransferase involved in cell wall biosynthesis